MKNDTFINAHEARLRAKKASPAEPIEHLLKVVGDAIARAAADGKFQIGDPLVGLRTPISADQRQRVWYEVKLHGFTVTTPQSIQNELMETVISWKEPIR